MDRLSPEQRSKLMSRVRRSDTAPELAIRRALHSNGWRYRLHAKDLPGTPDIVFRSRRVAVFVHGCFWHGHGCKLSTVPKTRPDYWISKISANKERDKRQLIQLVEMGWTAITVWQCDLRDINAVLLGIEEILDRALSRSRGK